MIAVILSCVLMLTVFLAVGDIFINLYKKLTGRIEHYSLIETFFIGLCITGSIICLTSLLLPSNIYTAFIFCIVPLIYLAIYRRNDIWNKIKSLKKDITFFQLICILSCIFIFVLFALVPPQFPDVFVYHIQNILWNEEYHVVPGLANIEETFGFNSNLFLLCSTFGLHPLFGQFIYAVNMLCTSLVFIYIIRQIKEQPIIIALLFLSVFIILFMVYKTHIGCSSTDLLPNLLIVFLLFLLITNPKHLKEKSILFWLIPFYCITLKLSTVFICLLSLYLVILLCKQKSYKAVYFIICAGLFIAVPWLIRNVIVSGYLIHPYPAIDLFNVDWKVPKEIALASNQYVKAFAITMEVWGTSNEYILNLPIGDKIQKWVAEKHPLDISIVAVGLLSVVLMAFSSLFKRRLAKDNIILVVLWIVGLCGFIFLLAMAPAVRFGYSFIAIVFAVPVYLLLKGKYNFLRFLPVNACLALTIIYLGILSVRYFRGIKEETYSYSELLWKPQGFESRIERFPFEQKTHIINGIQFTQPVDGGICYDCLLPCGYDMSGIEMRGTSLQDGFRKKEKQ